MALRHGAGYARRSWSSTRGKSSIRRLLTPTSCLQTAAEVVGNPLTANIIAAGAANALLGIAPDPLMEQAVRMHIPWGTEQINMLALKEGRRIGSRISH